MRRAVAGIVLASLLAGCTQPQTSPEPNAGLDGAPPFTLEVQVVDPASDAPIAGAAVTIDAGELSASATTDETGRAKVSLPTGAVIRVAAEAPGHVRVSTVSVRLGPEPPASTIARGLACGLSLGLACPRPEYTMSGSSGSLRVVMLPSEATLHLNVTTPAKAHLPQAETDEANWVATPIAFPGGEHAVRSVRDLAITLRWTNGPAGAADLDVAAGCDPSKIEAVGAGPGPTLGDGAAQVAWTPPAPPDADIGGIVAELADGCRAHFAGPVVRTGSTGIPATLEVRATFREMVQAPTIL